MAFSRRDFMASALVGSLFLGLGAHETEQRDSKKAQLQTLAGKRPILISAGNGFPYIAEAFNMLKGGADTLDAAMRVVRGPEDDAEDDSVGLGGLPNEEGVVELDSCCMHGP